MSTDAQTGDSSSPAEPKPFKPTTATDKAVAANDFSAFRDARLAERTGQSLAKEPAASPAAEPVEQVGSTDSSSSPASEPGQPSGHKGNLSTRTAEIDKEVAALQEKLKLRAQLRSELAAIGITQTAPPASQPAVTTPSDKEPQLEDFATAADPYAAWTDARIEYRATRLIDARLAAEQAKAQQTQTERDFATRATTFQERVNEAHAADPTLAARTKIELFDFVPSSRLPQGQTVTTHTDLAEGLLHTESPAILMAHLSDHPEALSTLLASVTPVDFWRQFGQIEQEVRQPAVGRPQKTITDAPRPPRVVGTRTEPLDDLEAAVRGDDMAAFKEAKIAKRRAAMR